MNFLFCGDVMGRAGRRVLFAHLPELRRRLALDFVIANGENAAHGFGITGRLCGDFYDAGVDVITTGNHVWDQREIIDHIKEDRRLLRPANYPENTPGRGFGIFQAANGRRVGVLNILTRLFMEAVDDPFACLEGVLAEYVLGRDMDALVIDVHGEASSEKMALGHCADGRASLVVGTHSHVPTADGQILPGGTGYQTDAGMCGDYDSVIGMIKERALARFAEKQRGERLEPATGEGTLCAVFAEVDEGTGLARRVAPLRLGGRLQQAMPSLAEAEGG